MTTTATVLQSLFVCRESVRSPIWPLGSHVPVGRKWLAEAEGTPLRLDGASRRVMVLFKSYCKILYAYNRLIGFYALVLRLYFELSLSELTDLKR